MAKFSMLSAKALNSIICLLLLATTFVSSARLLDEVNPQNPANAVAPEVSDPIPPPDTDIPEPEPPLATATTTNVAPIPNPIAPTEPAPVVAPIPDTDTPPLPTTAPPVTTPATTTTPPQTTPAATTVPPVTTPTTTTTNPATAGAATPIPTGDHPTFFFFMHDILGGSHPSGRVVAGLAANSDANAQLPFSKPSNPIFPINGGVPLNTVNGVINDNNFPSLVGLNGGGGATLVQSNGNNAVPANNGNQAFVTAGQLPAGLTVQQLMFGSVTVVDNEITEGHELGTGVLGKVQGFYLTSSSDGSSHTLSLTAIFHGGDHEHGHEIVDTISFFGVHRTATPISHIAIIGGTGKYENGKGYATIETLPHEDQHTTDGLETITHFTVYLTP